MKKQELVARAALSICAAAFLATACFDLVNGERNAGIRVSFEGLSPSPSTRAAGIPDADDFILTLSDSQGGCIWTGRFGDSPDSFEVSPGVYTVSAVSCEFTQPAFDCPQYGDTKVVVAAGGQEVSVVLVCSQLNCGLRLRTDSDFMYGFPDADIYMKDASGVLMYTYGETRTAYFNPGPVSVMMGDRTLFSRKLEARQMLTLTLTGGPVEGGAQDSGEGVCIQVDTTHEWLSESYVYGQEGGESGSAMSVSEAREAAVSGDALGTQRVWVCGYIAGCATSTSKILFDGPYTKATNIVLGERSATTDRSACLTVELPAGAVRDALNLVDNPDLKGRRIRIRGDLVPSYYGLPGLKTPTAYEF